MKIRGLYMHGSIVPRVRLVSCVLPMCVFANFSNAKVRRCFLFFPLLKKTCAFSHPCWPFSSCCRFSAFRGFNRKCFRRKANAMVDAQVLEKLEAGFKKLEASDSKSLLKKYLTREVFDNLKTKKTSFGSTLLDVIQSGKYFILLIRIFLNVISGWCLKFCASSVF